MRRMVVAVERGSAMGSGYATKLRRFIHASRSDGIIDVAPAGSRGRGIIAAAPGGFRQRGFSPATQRSCAAFSRPGGSAAKAAGFTLLEVIIAFAVLALALTLLLGTLSGSVREVRDSADAGRAALHAQSLLDQVGVGEALRPGNRDGEFEDGRYRWRLDIDPYADPARPVRDTIDPGAPRLMLLDLHVEWGEGGPRERLDLQSLRLAQPEALGAAL